MFEILSCRGTGFESRVIEDVTRGDSHIRIRFLADYTGLDSAGNAVSIKSGNCVEAWNTWVRRIVSWDIGYEKGTVIKVFSLRNGLTDGQFLIGARFLCRQIGKPYDLAGCERLLPGAQHVIAAGAADLGYWNYDKWFCSELADALFEVMDLPPFNVWKPAEVSPAMLPNSLLFNRECKTLIV